MNKRLKKCPVCNIDLEIREFYCPECDITIRGSFSQSELASLTLSQQEFVKIFLISQGNIKEVEKRLNISYPTVKSRLAEIINIIGGKEQNNYEISNILQDIEKGGMTVDQAIKRIQDLQGGEDESR